MYKNIVILAKSKKYNNYCIAGMDMKTKKWIRVISEDDSISFAVPKYDVTYPNGTDVDILDIVRIDFKCEMPFPYQPENWVYNPKEKWYKIGKIAISEVYKMIKQDNDEYIFYNSKNKIDSNLLNYYLEKYPNNIYSLKLIFVETLKIIYNNYKGKDKYYGSFCYNDLYYDKIAITDSNYLRELASNNKELIKKNVYLVLSLGERFEKDNSHYKLIASIIGG